MFSVILLILKIIGITLLVLIGLFLVILLTVLIVPIRYRVQAEHGEEKLYIVAKTSWLLHLLGVYASYVDGVFHVRMRVLWIILYDNLKPNIKRRKKIKAGKKTHKRTAKSSSDSKSVVPSKRNININKKNIDKNNIYKNKNSIEKNNIDNNYIEKNSAGYSNVQDNNPDNNNVVKKEQALSHVKHDVIITKHELQLPSEKSESSHRAKFTQEEKRKPLFGKIIDKIRDKIINIINTIIMIKGKIVAFFAGIKPKIIKWFNSIRKIKHKISLILNFIKDEVNKDGFGVTFSTLKKLLKHILPTKLRSRIVFGTGDPCSTGQALGVVGFVYGIYGDKVQIIPDFENKILEGKHDARGRIRLITVLILVIKLILDKRFKKLKNNFQILKEAL